MTGLIVKLPWAAFGMETKVQERCYGINIEKENYLRDNFFINRLFIKHKGGEIKYYPILVCI